MRSRRLTGDTHKAMAALAADLAGGVLDLDAVLARLLAAPPGTGRGQGRSPSCHACGLVAGDVAALRELAGLRLLLREVIALAAEMPALTDGQLRARLARLGERARAG